MSAAAPTDPSLDRLGWVGAGRMGAALVERLLDGGRELSLYNRTSAKAEPLRAAGATLVVVFQAALNIAVETAVVPPKGISLPFLSQGGSNLLVSLLATGLIVGVARHRTAVPAAGTRKAPLQ